MKYAIYLTASGTATARPVTGMIEIADLPEEDFATRLADQVALLNVGESYIQVPDSAEFTDLDNDTNTNDFTVNTTAVPPVALTPVSVARLSLEQKQDRVRIRRDAMLADALQLFAGDRLLTDADLATVATYFNALRAIPNAPASPDTVSWPTLGALANNAAANLITRSYRQGNIIAPVGFTSGIPNGGIIETATTIDGLYIRFADGGQLCRARITPVFFNSVRLATSWSFPAAFHALSSYSFHATFSTHNNLNAVAGLADTIIRQCQVMSRGRSTTSIDIPVLSPSYAFVSGDFVWLDISAAGRFAA